MESLLARATQRQFNPDDTFTVQKLMLMRLEHSKTTFEAYEDISKTPLLKTQYVHLNY